MHGARTRFGRHDPARAAGGRRRTSVDKFARDCPQGSPASPSTFATSRTHPPLCPPPRRRLFAQILAADKTQCATDAEENAPLTLSPPEIRSIAGSDWYVWLGEGGLCGEDRRPMLLNQLVTATYGRHELTVGIAAASTPDDSPTAEATTQALADLRGGRGCGEDRRAADPAARTSVGDKAGRHGDGHPAASDPWRTAGSGALGSARRTPPNRTHCPPI